MYAAKHKTPKPNKPCPACGETTLKQPATRNAFSRYVNVYICSPCGMSEALDGFFWRLIAERDHAPFIKPHHKREASPNLQQLSMRTPEVAAIREAFVKNTIR